MANEEQLALLKRSVEEWNAWRQENPGVPIDLTGAYLVGANLQEANLAEAILMQAVLARADLRGAVLRMAVLAMTDLSSANLCYANLAGAYLNTTNLMAADLTHAELGGALLIGSNLREATLKGCHVYGVSVWNCDLDGAEQSQLFINLWTTPQMIVDDLELAQFVNLLLSGAKIRSVIDVVARRGVLILGRFRDGGLEALQRIAAGIRQRGYMPMLFDFEPIEDRDFTETVKIMVGLSRFVIVDLSGPSVPKELEATVPDFEVPFIPIIEQGRRFPSMTPDLTKYTWFRWPPVVFADTEQLVERLQEDVIDPAEEMGRAREARRALLFSAQDK